MPGLLTYRVRLRLAVLDIVPSVAIILAVVARLTCFVVTVNVAVVCPAGTVTVAGTVAEVLLLARVITRPPVGAGPDMVTVPVELALPPDTEVGFNVSDTRVAAVMVSVPLLLVPPNAAVIEAVVCAATPVVVTVNVAEFLPAATATVAGTLAAGLPLDRFTVTPPAGAFSFRVTVPVEDVPPVTVGGLRVTEPIPTGLSVTRAGALVLVLFLTVKVKPSNPL
jgi:hypothetical protein